LKNHALNGVKKLFKIRKKILKSGTPEDLAADETVRRVYLGKNFS
jgi:hypothetical protein